MRQVKTCTVAGVLEAVEQLAGLISRRLGSLRERRPSVILGAGAEPDGSGLGSGRLDEIDSARGRARWRAGRQAQVGEDSDNHRRINDSGDDLQSAAAVRAVFEVDLEYTLDAKRAQLMCAGEGCTWA